MSGVIHTDETAVRLLQDVARMAVHAGKGLDKGAGSGYVGMINGLTVKIATHWGERSRAEVKGAALRQSCDALRESLMSALDQLSSGRKNRDEFMTKIRGILGLGKVDGKGNEIPPPLITRKIAVKVLEATKDAIRDSQLNLNERLGDVTGEATIRHSGTAALCELSRGKSEFMDKTVAPLLETLYPGDANKLVRGKVAAQISAQVVIQGGRLCVPYSGVSFSPEETVPAESLRKVPDLETAMSKIDFYARRCGGVGTVGSDDFRLAIALLYRKAQAGGDWNVEAFARNEVPVGDGRAMPKLPSMSRPEDRAFAIFKDIASVVPPERNQEGAVVKYHSYQSALASLAAADANKSVEDLTLQDLRGYVAAHLADSPAKLGCPGASGDQVLGMSIGSFLEGARLGAAGLKADSRVLPEMTADAFAKLSDEEFTQYLTIAGCKVEGKKQLPISFIDSKSVFSHGGGLVAVNEETFQAGEKTVTSRATPLRKFSKPRPNQMIANLALTEFEQDGKTVFKGIRFGSVNAKNGDICRQHEHYGQLVEQTLFANTALLEKAKREGHAELTLCRVDMSDGCDLQDCGDKYTIDVDGQKITVKPTVLHFRLQTDGAELVEAGKDPRTGEAKEKWVALSRRSVQSNDEALEGLGKRAETSTDPAVRQLARQLTDYWTQLKRRHGDGQGNIQLFKGYGAEMMKFGARLTVLAGLLGEVPSFNCSGGRDRTGLMDVECKVTAKWLADGKTLPSIAEGADELSDLRVQVRDKSGNQSIARQISLNNDDMYTRQVMGIASRGNKKLLALPETIRDNAGGERCGHIDWTLGSGNRVSGLEEMYLEG